MAQTHHFQEFDEVEGVLIDGVLTIDYVVLNVMNVYHFVHESESCDGGGLVHLKKNCGLDWLSGNLRHYEPPGFEMIHARNDAVNDVVMNDVVKNDVMNDVVMSDAMSDVAMMNGDEKDDVVMMNDVARNDVAKNDVVMLKDAHVNDYCYETRSDRVHDAFGDRFELQQHGLLVELMREMLKKWKKTAVRKKKRQRRKQKMRETWRKRLKRQKMVAKNLLQKDGMMKLMKKKTMMKTKKKTTTK